MSKFRGPGHRLGNNMLAAAYSADLFILLHDKDLEGALMEYGVARFAIPSSDKKQIVVVQLEERDSTFLHGDRIILLDSLEALHYWIETNC
ncbi:hypothetical protein L0Y40_00935 [Candidatus Wolfebacteria bacterium]|nr:hypothetical protein [Candidatus Wolfebacteria bacterium]